MCRDSQTPEVKPSRACGEADVQASDGVEDVAAGYREALKLSVTAERAERAGKQCRLLSSAFLIPPNILGLIR
jgi:hypothetical protein